MTENICNLIMELSSVFRTLVLMLCFMGLWNHLIEPEREKRKYALFIVLVMYLIILDMIEIPSYIRYFPIFVLCVSYVYFFKICKWEKPTFLLLLLYNMHAMSFLIANSFYQLFGEKLNAGLDMNAPDVVEKIYFQTGILQIALMLTYTIIFGCLYLIFIKMKPELSDMTIMEFVFLSVQNIAGIILAYMVVSLSVVPLEKEVFILYEQAADSLWKIPVIAALLLAGEYASIFTFSRYKQYLLERESVISRELGLKQLEQRFEEAQVLYGNLRSLRHDMKNHMQIIQGLIDKGQAKDSRDYIDRLNEVIEEIDGKFSTGNTLCDVVLNDKYRIAIKDNIRMSVDFSYDGGIADFDMGIILSNLCDNAIEACKNVTNFHRWIHISLITSEPCVLLTVRNSYDGKKVLLGENGLPISTKIDDIKHNEYHGMGLRNVSAIADSYFGKIQINTEEKEFCTTVMLQKRAN